MSSTVILVAFISLQTVFSLRIDARARQTSKWGAEDYDYVSYNEDKDLLKLRYSVIFPGTKWCGTGDIARNYDDLGEDRRTDMCCRAHDLCPDIIPSGESKHGLTNYAIHTRLSCECDNAFHKCLHATHSSSADLVGTIYFNLLDTQCFRKGWFWYGWHDVRSYFE